MKEKRNILKEALFMGAVNICYKPDITYEDEKLQNAELTEPCIIICNHMSAEDGVVVRYLFRNKNVCSLMAKDLLEKPFFKYLVGDCQCIPVDRKNASTKWIHECEEQMKEGKSVIIFPEGTTIKENAVEDFKSGFIMLAMTTGAKVLPVATNGKYKLFSRKKLRFKVGTPMPLNISKMTISGIEDEAERFKDIVKSMYDELDEDDNVEEYKNTNIA